MTVIIADENIVIRKKLRQILENQGIEVIAEAANGLHAFNKYAEYNPDLLFMNINMPIYDGLSALKRIRYHDDHSFVIMMSEAGRNRMIFEALELGAAHYIELPLNEAHVLKVLKDVSYIRDEME